MSMLAEPRRRKNYVLTPRGKPLYDDDSRFGCKMLQKMGWTKGKGLGAKESGEADFVRVKLRNNLSGLGFDCRDDLWTEHENGFNGLLQTLNGNDNEEQQETEVHDNDHFQTTGFGFETEKSKNSKPKTILSGESLEEKSKKSKVRVHYKKFTKSKDLSQYSTKDLANIFGKRTFEANEQPQNVVESHDDNGLTEEKSNSIRDYFKEKMEKLKRKQSDLTSDLIPACPQEGDNRSGTSITNYFKSKMDERKSMKNDQNDNILEEAQGECDEVTIRDKKRKKKKSKTNRNPDKELNDDTFCPIENKTKKRSTQRKGSGEKAELNENAETQNEEPALKKRKKDKLKKKEIAKEELSPETHFSVEEKTRTEENENECKTFADSNRCKSITTPCEESQTSNIEDRIQNENEAENVDSTTKSNKSLFLPNSSKQLQQAADLQVCVKLIPQSLIKSKKTAMETESYHEKLQEFNNYIISSYAAEKFRRIDLDSFRGSNLKDINGYSFHKDTKLNISKNSKDEKQIIAFWEGSVNKYISSKNKEVHATTSNINAAAAQPTKTKTKKKYFQRNYKRKSAFKLGI